MGKLFYVGAPPLHSLLRAEGRAVLEQHARRADYASDALVYARGDPEPAMVIVRTGEVEVGNFDLSGRFTATARLGTGHCFGEGAMLSGSARLFSARATMPTVADHLDRAAFDALAAEAPDVCSAITRILAIRFQNLLGFVEDMRSQPLNVRLAKALLAISENRAADSAVQAGLDELATMLGVSPVALTGVVARFEREGLAARRGGAIDVPDRDALLQWVARRTSRSAPAAAVSRSADGAFAARRALPRATSG